MTEVRRWSAAAWAPASSSIPTHRIVRSRPAVQDDDRQAAILDDRAALVVEGVAVGDEPVDDGRAHDVVGAVAVGAARDQHEGHARLVACLADAAHHQQ